MTPAPSLNGIRLADLAVHVVLPVTPAILATSRESSHDPPNRPVPAATAGGAD